jgi:hypothetical protein
MDKKIVYALVAGIVVYLLIICLAYVQRDLTIHQLILLLAAPFVMGLLCGGIKNGVILSVVVSFVMLMVELIVISPGAFTNINVVLAFIVMTLPFVGISAGLGAVGGLVGRRIFKNKEEVPS